jgi:hypothetical protein
MFSHRGVQTYSRTPIGHKCIRFRQSFYIPCEGQNGSVCSVLVSVANFGNHFMSSH